MIVTADKIPASALILDINRVKLSQLKKYVQADDLQVVHVIGTPDKLEAIIYTYHLDA